MSASPVIPGVIAALSVLDGFLQRYRAGPLIDVPEPDRAAAHVIQNIHVGQRVPALENAEPELEFAVREDVLESSPAGALVDQCPAWQHGTPVQELPLARNLLVDMANSYESFVRAAWTYFAAMHGAIGCLRCRRREAQGGRLGRRVFSARAYPAW